MRARPPLRCLLKGWAILPAFLALLPAAVPASASATVVAVFPSGRSVPENLLRLSIVFSGRPPVPALPHLTLLRADGSVIDRPFLEQELWAPDGRTLTILLHPGRVKIGLIAHEMLGRALRPGETVRLAWDGQTLKSWTVGLADTAPPDPAAWRLRTPAAGSRAPLTVTLDRPVEALDGDLIAVASPSGYRLSGRARLGPGQTSWSFRPTAPWQAGTYALRVNPNLENPCGNRVGETFEHTIAGPGTAPPSRAAPSFSPAR